MSVKRCGAVLRFLGLPKLLANTEKPRHFVYIMTEDDLVSKYALEAEQSIKDEAQKRLDEFVDPIRDAKLKKKSLFEMVETEEIVPALLSRLGVVRAALDGHGGGIKIASFDKNDVLDEAKLDFVLDLTGACLSCGAAPGTLQGIKQDLEGDFEINTIKFSKNLLDTFDELGREFILEHGNVDFV